MFYHELFECIPLKVGDRWCVVTQDKTLSGFKEWLNYIGLEEGKLITYLLRLDYPARQQYIDDVIERLIEACNQSEEAYKETDNNDIFVVFLAVRSVLGCLVFRFNSLSIGCSVEIINKWNEKFPFLNDFPMVETASTDKPKEKKIELPIDLDTDRARKYIGKAIEAGLIKVVDDGLRWTITKKGGKVRLAYFLFRVYCQDDNNKDNGLSFPETALNTLFRESRLGHSLSQIANNKKQGYPEIDKIFE